MIFYVSIIKENMQDSGNDNITIFIVISKHQQDVDPQKDKIFKGLKIGVLSPAMLAKKNTDDAATRERLNALYAKDFKLYNDLKLVMGNIFLLGRD